MVGAYWPEAIDLWGAEQLAVSYQPSAPQGDIDDLSERLEEVSEKLNQIREIIFSDSDDSEKVFAISLIV